MAYFENVKIAGLALQRGEAANWELARLTHENTVDGPGNRAGGGKMDMATWCRDVADVAGRPFSVRSGRLYKRIWERIGANVQAPAHFPAFGDAYATVAGDDRGPRFDDWAGRTVADARPEVKVETFKRLAEDPEVRADREAQSAALDFGVQVYRQREQDVREHWRADETAERQEERLEAIDTALALEREIAGALTALERRIAPLLEKNRPTGSEFIGLRSAVQRGRELLDRIDYWIAHGEDEVDAFARSVLRGE